MSERDELLRLLKARGILRAGEDQQIIDRGGDRAAWMLYAWPITMTTDGLRMIAREMLRLLEPFAATQLAANGFGAVPLMSAMLLEGRGRYRGMVIRPARKQHGATRRIDGAGERSGSVVVIDDSISSGTSFREACRELEQEGYEVEGAACLVDFPYRGGREQAEARGYRVATVFDIWADLEMLDPPPLPEFLQAMPRCWSDWTVPNDLHPAVAARRVAEHYILTGETMHPPQTLATFADGRGGVFVSIRRRRDDRRIGRDGFWHFDPADADMCRDVVLATVRTLQGLRRVPSLVELGAQLKLAVTFFGPLTEVSPAQLDFSRFGVVVSSRVFTAHRGGALPNTQFFTSTYEQYRHARWTNARISAFEPHQVFRHELAKLVEPGCDWPAYGTDVLSSDGWLEAAQLQDVVLDRVQDILARLRRDEPVPPSRVLGERLTGRPVGGVGVSLYDRGIAGCTVSFASDLDEALVKATRGALRDSRFGSRDSASFEPEAIVVSLMHSTENLGSVPAAEVAQRLRRGKDGLSVRQGDHFAVYLDSVPVHYDWTRQHMVTQLLKKATIDSGEAQWATHKVKSWLAQGDSRYEIEGGFPVSCARDPLGVPELELMAEHLVRRLDMDCWPAYAVKPQNGTLERSGTAARCLHALAALDAAGRSLGRSDWVDRAGRGISFALSRLGQDEPVLDIRHHSGGPAAEASLLAALAASRHAALESPSVDRLVQRVVSWVRPDGSVRPDGVLPSAADHDFLPGIALLALSRYCLETGACLGFDWEGVCRWYRRRGDLLHPWGLMPWHAQVWNQVGRLTGNTTYHETAIALGTWMAGQQLDCDGSFLTDLYNGPSFHAAFASEGVAAAWHSAILLKRKDDADLLKQSWVRAMTFMQRLLVRREDTFWMPNPVLAAGGIRCAPESSDMRVDYTSHTVIALLGGLTQT